MDETAADRRELRIDTPLGTIAATWCAPRDRAPGDPVDRPTLVCIPGGTYGRGYFDLHVPEHPGYSFVDHAVGRGWATVAVDVLGTGESARPTTDVDLTAQADALAHVLPALADLAGPHATFVAVGHSMGGYVALRQQAAHRSYVALAILGTTNQHVAPLGLPAEMLAAATTPEGRRAILEQIVSAMPEPYLAGDRGPLASWFHLPDVPRAVLLADEGLATVIPRRCAAAGTVPGIGIADAATVDVPVMLAYGDLDVSPAPHLEPSFFTAARDVTLYRLEGSAHCHNSATTRTQLWDRLLAWAGTVA